VPPAGFGLFAPPALPNGSKSQLQGFGSRSGALRMCETSCWRTSRLGSLAVILIGALVCQHQPAVAKRSAALIPPFRSQQRVASAFFEVPTAIPTSVVAGCGALPLA